MARECIGIYVRNALEAVIRGQVRPEGQYLCKLGRITINKTFPVGTDGCGFMFDTARTILLLQRHPMDRRKVNRMHLGIIAAPEA